MIKDPTAVTGDQALTWYFTRSPDRI